MNELKLTNYKNEKSNEIKTNNILKKIKSGHILNKIFNLLKKIRTIQVIKYNKKIQYKLNISKKFFKEYTEIEIEIIPSQNQYGKFLRIYDKQLEKYYHIYFNDSKK